MKSHELPLDHWGIATMQSAALRKGAWIEVISLGYTLLEVQVRYLLRQNKSGVRVPEEEIEKCRFLLQLADLAHGYGLLPDDIYEGLKVFNDARRRAIHHLATYSVKASQLEECAKSVIPLEASIQNQWLKFDEWKWVPAEGDR